LLILTGPFLGMNWLTYGHIAKNYQKMPFF